LSSYAREIQLVGGCDGVGIEVEPRCVDGPIERRFGVAEPAECALLPKESTTRRRGIPGHHRDHVDFVGSHDIGCECKPEPKADYRKWSGSDRASQEIDRRANTVSPRIDAVGVGESTRAVSGAVVVEA
jgi:hypothetical protein